MARKEPSGKKGDGSAKGNPSGKGKRPSGGRPGRPSTALLNYGQMKALSKEDRVKIFAVFCERVASPKEISDELGIGLSQVSYHVSVLRECNLIVPDHKIPRRGAVEHFYRATAPTLIPPAAWDNLPHAMQKTISLGILQEFFEDAHAAIEAEVFDNSPGELGWTPLILDALGIEELGRLSRDFLDAVLELQAGASERLSKGNGKAADATSATVFLASFLSARNPKEGRGAFGMKRR